MTADESCLLEPNPSTQASSKQAALPYDNHRSIHRLVEHSVQRLPQRTVNAAGMDRQDRIAKTSSVLLPFATSGSAEAEVSSSASVSGCGSSAVRAVCGRCRQSILDPYVLIILGSRWHEDCVCCCKCDMKLTETCFYRMDQFYCREHYIRQFGQLCAGCNEPMLPMDRSHYAWGNPYHVDCFRCSKCKKEMRTGENIYALDQTRFICEEDHKANGVLLNEGEFLQDAISMSTCDRSETAVLMGDRSTAPAAGAFRNERDCQNRDKKRASLTSSSACDIASPMIREDDVGDDAAAAAMMGMSPSGDASMDMGEIGDMMGGDSGSAGDTITSPGCHSSSQGDANTPRPGSTGGTGSEKEEGMSEEGGSVGKRRGPRTTIKPNQLEMLVAAFSDTSKPGRSVREKLSQETGLTMRVIQVWFQNRRSKERRLNNNSLARRQYLPNRPPGVRRSQSSGLDSPEMGGHYTPYGYPHDGGQPDYYSSYGGPYPSAPSEFFPGGPMTGHPDVAPPMNGPGGPYIPQHSLPQPHQQLDIPPEGVHSTGFLPPNLSPRGLMPPAQSGVSNNSVLQNAAERYAAVTSSGYGGGNVGHHHQPPIESW